MNPYQSNTFHSLMGHAGRRMGMICSHRYTGRWNERLASEKYQHSPAMAAKGQETGLLRFFFLALSVALSHRRGKRLYDLASRVATSNVSIKLGPQRCSHDATGSIIIIIEFSVGGEIRFGIKMEAYLMATNERFYSKLCHIPGPARRSETAKDLAKEVTQKVPPRSAGANPQKDSHNSSHPIPGVGYYAGIGPLSAGPAAATGSRANRSNPGTLR